MTAANPNGPRAQLMREAAKFRADILLCLETYGPLTNEQLCELTGAGTVKVRSKMGNMKREGLVHAELVEGDECPYVAIYHLGPGEDSPLDGIKQRIVRKWKPQMVKHDPLHMAFFGQQKG